MAVAVTQAIEKGQPLVVEQEPVRAKPTLTWPLRCGRKESHYLDRLKSVAGSALQPRLPTVSKALKYTGNVALLKGR